MLVLLYLHSFVHPIYNCHWKQKTTTYQAVNALVQVFVLVIAGPWLILDLWRGYEAKTYTQGSIYCEEHPLSTVKFFSVGLSGQDEA